MINNWFNSKDRIKKRQKVALDFEYSSNSNNDWMSVDTLRKWIKTNL